MAAAGACGGERDEVLTGFSPHGQVFILLDVQHQLQAITHPSLGGDAGRAAIIA